MTGRPNKTFATDKDSDHANSLLLGALASRGDAVDALLMVDLWFVGFCLACLIAIVAFFRDKD